MVKVGEDDCTGGRHATQFEPARTTGQGKCSTELRQE